METANQQPAHVSVVICTRNREDKIANAVGSVLAVGYPSFDLTIIDQSTSDGTRKALEDILAADSRVSYHHFDEAGLSRAYNRGIERSTGEIMAFTDDDCIVPEDWLTSIVRAFDAEPDGELLYGRVVPFGEGAENDELTPSLDVPVPRRLSKKDGFQVFGMGANYAARRSLFDRIGPFDEVLGGGGALKSSQDFDIAYRAYKAGSVTLLRPEVSIRHDGRREREDWPALLLAYGTGDGGFYTKHARCRDPYAMYLLTRQLGGSFVKWVVKVLLLRHPNNWNYIRGFLTGLRGSFRFKVDRKKRLYRTA